MNSKTKQFLLARREELMTQLRPFKLIQEELDQVNAALISLEPKTCNNGCSGCEICRRGPDYR